MSKINPVLTMVKKQKKDNDLKKEATKFGYSKYDIEDIKIRKNPRKIFDEKKLKELAKSIEENGLLHPIVIDGDLNLIAGERRLRACKLLGYTEIKAIKHTRRIKNPEILSLLENIQRENLRISELRHCCFELNNEHKIKQTDIAKQLGVSKGWVSELINSYKILKRLGKENENLSAHDVRNLEKLNEDNKDNKKFGMPNFYKTFAKNLKKYNVQPDIIGNTITFKIENDKLLEEFKRIFEK